MTINYSVEYDFTFDFDCEDIAINVVKATLQHEHFPYDIELGLSLVDEEVIRRFNKDYRNIDKTTDVLSFPMIDFGDTLSMTSLRTEEMYGFIEDEPALMSPDSKEVNLGDIVLCIPKVISQAEEYNHSILREYAFLIAHSMLHLLGFDHIDENERMIMENKQSEILEALDISRDL